MSKELSASDLSKSAGNLKRIEQFFASRISWRVDGEGEQALAKMQQAASGLVDSVGGLLQANGIRFSDKSRPEHSPQEQPGDFEAIRLQRFAAFLEQLSQWFRGQGDAAVPHQGREILRSIHGSLCTTTQATKLILDYNRQRVAEGPAQPVVQEPEPTPAQAATPTPVPTPVPAAQPEVKVRVIKDPKKARLELVNTVERPLLVEFKGAWELSNHATDLISEFLADNEIEMSKHQLRKWLVKVAHWIEALPDGQALVLKISAVQDEPFPTYAPRSDK